MQAIGCDQKWAKKPLETGETQFMESTDNPVALLNLTVQKGTHANGIFVMKGQASYALRTWGIRWKHKRTLERCSGGVPEGVGRNGEMRENVTSQ